MASNSKFDTQLDRMHYLIGYDNKINESKKPSNLSYKTVGADDLVYGIIKEGNMYYIKTTEKGKEDLIESYNYINGYNYRNENGYKSYNEATKQLELKLMSLNEAYGKKSDVSTFDTDKNKKVFAELTESARNELDRLNQIIENSKDFKPKKVECKSNCKHEDKGEPFELEATPELDKDFTSHTTPVKANDFKTVKDVEKSLQSDKMKKIHESIDNLGDEDLELGDDDLSDDDLDLGDDDLELSDDDLDLGDDDVDVDGDVEDTDYELIGDTEDDDDVEMDDLLNEFLDNDSDECELGKPCSTSKRALGRRKQHQTLKEAIDRIVNEELAKQSEFGEHPNYRKPFMTLNGVKDNVPYGSKKGDSKPYDLLVDEIFDTLKTKLVTSKKA